jgi:two-component sensor histidine kinase
MVEVNQRLVALSRAHDVLTRNSWESADLKEIVAQALAPYAGFSGRLHISGKPTELSPRAGLAVAMALQELLTNAIKYGALSTANGEVNLWWVVVGGHTDMLQINWEESGGPAVTPPSHRGFGTRLIEAGLARDLNGTAHLDFKPSGLRCTFVIPLRGV